MAKSIVMSTTTADKMPSERWDWLVLRMTELDYRNAMLTLGFGPNGARCHMGSIFPPDRARGVVGARLGWQHRKVDYR